MNNSIEIVTTVTKRRISELIAKDQRLDGRGLLDYREMTVEVGTIDKASGSAYVKLGRTKVLAGQERFPCLRRHLRPRPRWESLRCLGVGIHRSVDERDDEGLHRIQVGNREIQKQGHRIASSTLPCGSHGWQDRR